MAFALLFFGNLASLLYAAPVASGLSDAELDRIGHRIWKSECDGTVDGLTSWNTGEEFASLGIGHFIWYPQSYTGPFDESFPKLVAWFKQRGVALPAWLNSTPHCPWPDKKSFERDHDGERQRDLRRLLSATLIEQTRFIVQRLHDTVPKYRDAAGRAAAHVERNIALLSATSAGTFAMIDYINFKGDGLNPKERYNGEGWGLLQVLMDMKADDARSAPAAFGSAARRMLERRVRNSPPERGEKRWLVGWGNRVGAYGK